MGHIYTHTLEDVGVKLYTPKLSEFTDDTMTNAHCLVRDWLWNSGQTALWDKWTNAHGGVSPIIYHVDRKIAQNLPRLPRRIHSLMRKEIDISLPDDLASRIGEIAAADTLPERYADVTHTFTWRGGDFGDARACFFNRQDSHNTCRVRTLPALNASAIRLYRDETHGMARCWAIPIPDGHELFDPDNLQFCITNYYSDTDVIIQGNRTPDGRGTDGTPVLVSPAR